MQQYFQGARRTGKTQRLLDSLQDGDRVIFATPQEARHFEQRCHPKKIQCLVRIPNFGELPLPRGAGRTVFDHGWVERFYEGRIMGAAATIRELETEMSGNPENVK